MLNTLELDYVQHLERGYCVNHPDVVDETKEQVVDRAVKQLLEALQANGFELDGNILKRDAGWLQYDADTWQYSNDGGNTWNEIGSGGGGSALPTIHYPTISAEISTDQMNGDIFCVQVNDIVLTVPAIGAPVGSGFWVFSAFGCTVTPLGSVLTLPLAGGQGGWCQSLTVGDSATDFGSIHLVNLSPDVWIALSMSGAVEFIISIPYNPE